jgi:ABC-2 type transport system permease protein
MPAGTGLTLAATLGFGFIAFIAFMTPFSVVIDTIAGERERHTLETLLASPASDGAILMGKALPIALVVVGNAVWFGLVSLASLPVLYGLPGFLLALALMLVGPVAGLVTASFTTGLGLFISQRAPTIKQGQQWLGYAMMPFFLVPSLSGPIGVALARSGLDVSPALFLLLAIGLGVLVLVGLNALFWVLAFTRFRRDRLLLR